MAKPTGIECILQYKKKCYVFWSMVSELGILRIKRNIVSVRFELQWWRSAAGYSLCLLR